MTSHAAVVARGMGKPCVAGCEGLDIDAGAEDGHASAATSCTRATRSRSTAAPAASSSARSQLVPPAINEDFETILGWADERPPPAGARERRHARGRGEGARVRRRGHRPLPHRAHVLRRGAAAGRAGDDPGLRRGRAAGRRSTGCCRSSRPTSRGSSRRWPACRSTIRLLDPPLHEFLPPLEEATDERDAQPDQGAPRGEPDARHPRLPPRHPVARDLRDAGARDRTGGEGRAASARATRRSSRSCTRSSRFKEELRRLRELTERVMAEEAPAIEYHVRHDDRAAAGCAPRGRDRRVRRLLLVRHERPHADDARVLARRRRGQVPHLLPRGRRHRAEPVRDASTRAASATSCASPSSAAAA